jgi:CRP-like cAMP-binding protein
MAGFQTLQGNPRFALKASLPVNAAAENALAWIRSSRLFAGLPDQVISEVAASARPRTFLRNELLFMQGHPFLALILLQSGSVKHTQVGPNGTEVLLRVSGKGDIVDFQAEARCCVHTCSARAIEFSRALVWDYRRIELLALRYPRLRDNITHLLCRKLEELEERFREMATEAAPIRLSLALARLVQQIGKPSQMGIQVHVRREELAQMTGSTIYTISRLLSGWSEQGFVVPRRESVVISHLEGLDLRRSDCDRSSPSRKVDSGVKVPGSQSPGRDGDSVPLRRQA